MIWGMSLFHDLSAERGRWESRLSPWLLQLKNGKFSSQRRQCWLQTPSFAAWVGRVPLSSLAMAKSWNIWHFPYQLAAVFAYLQEEPAGTYLCMWFLRGTLSKWVLEVQDSPARLFLITWASSLCEGIQL